MSENTVTAQNPFFSFVPDICCVGRIEAKPSAAAGGLDHCFKVYFSNQVDICFAFNDVQLVRDYRRDLILEMMKWFGPDQVVFSNGFHSEVAVVSAIESLTAIYEKDRLAGFSALLANAPIQMHFVFPDQLEAQRHRQAISWKIENHYRNSSRAMKVVAYE